MGVASQTAPGESSVSTGRRYGIRGLVIDPYNELDHQRPAHMNETEYVSQMLTKVKRFAQHNDVHVWFVAHPRQLQGWRGEPPNLYDISGSAHFINKADNGLVIHRNRDPEQGQLNHVSRRLQSRSLLLLGHRAAGLHLRMQESSPQHAWHWGNKMYSGSSGCHVSQVKVLVRKVRNKAAGTIGGQCAPYSQAMLILLPWKPQGKEEELGSIQSSADSGLLCTQAMPLWIMTGCQGDTTMCCNPLPTSSLASSRCQSQAGQTHAVERHIHHIFVCCRLHYSDKLTHVLEWVSYPCLVRLQSVARPREVWQSALRTECGRCT